MEQVRRGYRTNIIPAVLSRQCSVFFLVFLPTFLYKSANCQLPNVISVYANPRGCERTQTVTDSVTGELTYEVSNCPEWTPDVRLPAYCCGTRTGERTCCEWSTYVVNTVGFGRTSLGVFIFVTIFFVVAVLIFIVIAALFKTFVVAHWERQQEDTATLRRTSSRSSSRARRSGSTSRQLHGNPSTTVYGSVGSATTPFASLV